MIEKNYRREMEWNRLLTREQKFISARRQKRENPLNEKIERVMPDNLQSTLEKAFVAGFKVIFEKGTAVIEHTYNKQKIQNEYKVNAYAASVYNHKKGIRSFAKQARRSQNFNLALSAVEGGAMGLFGVGIPDIPLFIGVLLKSIYEIALHYGFSYQSPEEQMFILRLVEAAMCRGKELQLRDIRINRWIEGTETFDEDREGQIRQTAQVLSEALLYMKFVQSLPIVGVVGGAVDVWCLHEVTSYAQLKYQRRFLTEDKSE